MTDNGGRMAHPEYPGTHGIRWALGALAVAVTSLAGFGLGTGQAAADAWVTAPCQWAGQSFRQHDTVYAGGWAFACHTDEFGTPRWDRQARTAHHDTVYNPGADSYAAEGYSLGAWQPGTSFFDYCEGDNALIPGTDYVFEAIPFNGSVFWRASGSIKQWAFDPGVHHQYTFWESRTCTNGLVD